MNFACPSCQRRYTVPDEKVRGKSVKVKCKACGATITIEGPREAPPPPPADEGFEDRTVAFRSDEIAKLREQELQLSKAPAAQAAAGKDAPVWFVMVGEQQVGPLDIAGLRSKKVGGEVSAESYVWKDGMGEWKPARDVEELNLLFPKEAEPAAVPQVAASAPEVEAAPEAAPEPVSEPPAEPPSPASSFDDAPPAPPAEEPAPEAAASDALPDAPATGARMGELFDGEPEHSQSGQAPLVDVSREQAAVAPTRPLSNHAPVKKSGGALKGVLLVVLLLAVLAGAVFVLGVLGIIPLGGLLGEKSSAAEPSREPARMAAPSEMAPPPAAPALDAGTP